MHEVCAQLAGTSITAFVPLTANTLPRPSTASAKGLAGDPSPPVLERAPPVPTVTAQELTAQPGGTPQWRRWAGHRPNPGLLGKIVSPRLSAVRALTVEELLNCRGLVAGAPRKVNSGPLPALEIYAVPSRLPLASARATPPMRMPG